eukprot:GILI01020452.1.p1 GENE.GILI01020452.1~~GILI01020452.1.p1  ORF type:complete len:139 (+),score=21.64 GILI01020452.1:41-457(+)
MGDPFVKPGLAFRQDVEKVMLRNEGTGTKRTTAADWVTDQYRDTLSTIVQRRDLLIYTASSMGLSTARARHNMLEKMVDPLFYSTNGDGKYASSITDVAQVLPTKDSTGLFEMPMAPHRPAAGVLPHPPALGDKRPRT